MRINAVVKPESITAVVNDYYHTSGDSVYVDEFDYTVIEPLLEETIVVNFFKDAGDEANAHHIVKDGSIKAY